MKTCTSCHTEKPLTFFHKERLGVGGVKGKCKICTAAVCDAYREKSKRIGVCITCTEPAIPGRVNCIKHAQTVNVISQKQKLKRKDENRCITCGIPLHYQMDKGFKTCLNCRERS